MCSSVAVVWPGVCCMSPHGLVCRYWRSRTFARGLGKWRCNRPAPRMGIYSGKENKSQFAGRQEGPRKGHVGPAERDWPNTREECRGGVPPSGAGAEKRRLLSGVRPLRNANPPRKFLQTDGQKPGVLGRPVFSAWLGPASPASRFHQAGGCQRRAA